MTELDDYERLGITPETFACVAITTRQQAERFVFALACYGVEARVSRDVDGKRWHVAVKGGLKACPAAWIASVRGMPGDVPICPRQDGYGDAQHPQAVRPERIIVTTAD